MRQVAVPNSREINALISEPLNYSCSSTSNFFSPPFPVGWIFGVAHSCGGFVWFKMALKAVAPGVLCCDPGLERASKLFSTGELESALQCYCDFWFLSGSTDVQNKAFL